MRVRLACALAVLSISAVTLETFTIPASASESAPTTPPQPCQKNMFFGAHGLDQGSNGTATGPDHWGSAIDQVWNQFKAEQTSSYAESVSFNKITFKYPEKKQFTLYRQLAQVAIETNNAGRGLQAQLVAAHAACPDGAIVLTGYSQGAWVIDRALRNLAAASKIPVLGAENLATLKQVAGVFLMGDPAWPEGVNTSGGSGIINSAPFHVASVLQYKTKADYTANGIPSSDFWSVCVSGDPICDYDGKQSDIAPRLHIHIDDYTIYNLPKTPSVAQRGGDWLASRV
jgi:Cutinase